MGTILAWAVTIGSINTRFKKSCPFGISYWYSDQKDTVFILRHLYFLIVSFLCEIAVFTTYVFHSGLQQMSVDTDSSSFHSCLYNYHHLNKDCEDTRLRLQQKKRTMLCHVITSRTTLKRWFPRLRINITGSVGSDKANVDLSNSCD